MSGNLELEALRQAVRRPEVDQRSIVILAGQFLADRLDREGYDYFGERSKDVPDEVLFLTLAGVFQARLGEDPEEAVAKLDAAAERDLGLPNYFRGVTLAALPECGGRAETVVMDLEFVLAIKDQFPTGFMRAVYRGLSAAYPLVGREEEAADMLERSGPTDLPLLVTDFWANPEQGFHLVPQTFSEFAPGVYLAQGFSFSDIAFVRTSGGIVAIDAGTDSRSARAALAELRKVTDLPITHVILTHAHFDHIGGLDALTGPGTQVIAQSGFPEELALQYASPAPFPYLLPGEKWQPRDIKPDLLVSAPQTLTIGGTDFALHPIAGGETHDGLLIHLPAQGVLFVGDMIMPQLGAPFFPEGSAEGLLEAMDVVLSLHPDLLIHGHAGLTQNFPVASFPTLLAALRELRDVVLAGIADSLSLVEVLRLNHLPEVLREHPAAVTPYLVVREGFIQRLYRQNTGYWTPGGQDIEPVGPEDWAGALDILAGGSADAFVGAGGELLARGDSTLALRIVDAGRLRHPGVKALDDLRGQILHRLLERYQMISPFKFLYYAGLAGLDLPPVS